MASHRSLLIVGTGAQAKYTLDCCALRGVHVTGLVRLPTDRPVEAVGGARVLGELADVERLYREHDAPDLLIACSRPAVKEEVATRLRPLAPRYISLVHPSAVVSESAVLGQGVIVNATAVIQPFARIGDHVMIHAGVIVEHDCHVDDFANLAPRVALAGHVTVGRRAVLYTGAVVIPTVRIGEDAIVGAGSVVLSDLPARVTAVGVPARVVAAREPATV
jgi:acetyltransferase EpsM